MKAGLTVGYGHNPETRMVEVSLAGDDVVMVFDADGQSGSPVDHLC